MKIELHCHTNFSDGKLSPRQLSELIIKEKLDLVSVTDHDTVKAHNLIEPIMKASNIKYIPGIELTTHRNGESIHILGYFVNDGYKNRSFLNTLDELDEFRNNRTKNILNLLEKHFGIDIDYKYLRKKSKGSITRANIASEINLLFPNISHSELFDKYLSRESPAYIPNINLTIEEGISLLKNNGAIVILAHPVIYQNNSINDLLKYDFDGVECYYFLNSKEETEKYLKETKNRNLYITAGSDFHGIPNDKNHGYLSSVKYKKEDLEPFLNNFL